MRNFIYIPHYAILAKSFLANLFMIKLSMNANVMKAKTLDEIKFDLRGHL